MLTLYHGTSRSSAQELMKNGWSPASGRSGGQCGQSRYLYLTNVPENAQWYADLKENPTVLRIDVDPESLRVDPEDGIEDTVDAELSMACGLPGNVICFREINPSCISMLCPDTPKIHPVRKTGGLEM